MNAYSIFKHKQICENDSFHLCNILYILDSHIYILAIQIVMIQFCKVLYHTDEPQQGLLGNTYMQVCNTTELMIYVLK